MLRKFYHWSFVLCILMGLILIFCAAESSDLNLINLNVLIKQTLIGLSLIIVGGLGVNVTL